MQRDMLVQGNEPRIPLPPPRRIYDAIQEYGTGTRTSRERSGLTTRGLKQRASLLMLMSDLRLSDSDAPRHHGSYHGQRSRPSHGRCAPMYLMSASDTVIQSK